MPTRPSKLVPIRHRTFVDVPPERVYQTLTTGAGWDAWFTEGTVVDARAGGHIELRWVDWGADHITTRSRGPVLEAMPPARFAFQWTVGDSTTTVAFTLEPLASGTCVTVQEDGYGTSPEDLRAFADCACGWGEALTLLKMFLEHGIVYGRVPGPDD